MSIIQCVRVAYDFAIIIAFLLVEKNNPSVEWDDAGINDALGRNPCTFVFILNYFLTIELI